MRECRAWDKKNKIFRSGIDNICLTLGGYLMWQFGGKEPELLDLDEADNYILEQYTGKEDTDGIKIFENDRCTARYERQYIEGIVIYKNCSYWIRWKDGNKNVWLGSNEISQVTVVGNTHENP